MHVIIPARYASSRLPGKPLLDIAGKPLIQRVYECATASGAPNVVVATDDERIAACVRGFGGRACMTSDRHQSGTDRLAEAIALLRIADDEIVVNLQGDEPRMPPRLLRQVADLLAARIDAVMSTARHAISDYASFTNPNVTKVVCDESGYALYFSRAPIPWPREAMGVDGKNRPATIQAHRHIGLYAYRAGFVREYAAWPACPIENLEALEQLRVLWAGRRIVVAEADVEPGPGVDTPADLERARAYFTKEAAGRVV